MTKLGPNSPPAAGRRIAVVGAGAAGLTAAYLLGRRHEVTLFERNDRLGGHAYTFVVPGGDDAGLPLDIGFMVFNERTYPAFHKLIAGLPGVSTGECDMSFSYYLQDEGIHYAYGYPKSKEASLEHKAKTPAWLQQPPNDATLQLIREIFAFGMRAKQDLGEAALGNRSLGDYLRDCGFSENLTQYYIIPTAAGTWTTLSARVLEMPAQTFVQHLANHGLLDLKNVPQWKYIRDGSHTYIAALLAEFTGRVETGAQIESIARQADGPVLRFPGGRSQHFDEVVLATHADEALRLLADPSPEELRWLGVWKYQTNRALLHTDPRVMPPDRKTWSCWNFWQRSAGDPSAAFTYYLNQVQGLATARRDYFATFNCQLAVPDDAILCQTEFTHQLYTPDAIASQAHLPALNGVRHTYYCGSYFGYGFHEDAVVSAAAVARLLGVEF